MKKYVVLFVVNIKKLKNPKISYIFKLTLVVSIICSSVALKKKRYLKKKNKLWY